MIRRDADIKGVEFELGYRVRKFYTWVIDIEGFGGGSKRIVRIQTIWGLNE